MPTSSQSKVDIAVITDIGDIPTVVSIEWACFGEHDAILQAFRPGWETPEGYTRAVERVVDSFKSSTNVDKNGNALQIWLKATVTDSTGKQTMAGCASWIVLSTVEEYGLPLLLDAREALDVEELCPGDVSEQQYTCTLFDNLYRQRTQLTQQQSSATPPAVMCLDMCVVHPSFQRQGIASKFVEYGLKEAERRGGLVCCTEASLTGKPLYAKSGFRSEGPDIEFGVDGAKFARNGMPSYTFMKT